MSERFCPAKKSVMPRELIDPGTDKRFVRRDDQGRFKKEVDVGQSLAVDRRQHAKTKVKRAKAIGGISNIVAD